MHNNWDMAVVLRRCQQPVAGVVFGAVITNNIFLNICSQLLVFITSNNPAEVETDFIKQESKKTKKAQWKYSAALF